MEPVAGRTELVHHLKDTAPTPRLKTTFTDMLTAFRLRFWITVYLFIKIVYRRLH